MTRQTRDRHLTRRQLFDKILDFCQKLTNKNRDLGDRLSGGKILGSKSRDFSFELFRKIGKLTKSHVLKIRSVFRCQCQIFRAIFGVEFLFENLDFS